jgi:hypothetical protein
MIRLQWCDCPEHIELEKAFAAATAEYAAALDERRVVSRSRLAWHTHLRIGTGSGLPFVYTTATITMAEGVCNGANGSII